MHLDDNEIKLGKTNIGIDIKTDDLILLDPFTKLKKPIIQTNRDIESIYDLSKSTNFRSLEGKKAYVEGGGTSGLAMAWALREAKADVTVVTDFEKETALEGALGIIEEQDGDTLELYIQSLSSFERLIELGAPLSKQVITYHTSDAEQGSSDYFKRLASVPGCNPSFEHTGHITEAPYTLKFNGYIFNGTSLREFLVTKLSIAGVKFKHNSILTTEIQDDYDIHFSGLGIGYKTTPFSESIIETSEAKTDMTYIAGQILRYIDPENLVKITQGIPGTKISINIVKDPVTGIVSIGASKETEEFNAEPKPTLEMEELFVRKALEMEPKLEKIFNDKRNRISMDVCLRPYENLKGTQILLFSMENTLFSTVIGLGGAGNSIIWGAVSDLVSNISQKIYE